MSKNRNTLIELGLLVVVALGGYIVYDFFRKAPAPAVVTEDIPHEEVPPVDSTPVSTTPPVTSTPAPAPPVATTPPVQSVDQFINDEPPAWSTVDAQGNTKYLDGSYLTNTGLLTNSQGAEVAFNVTDYSQKGVVSLKNGSSLVRTKAGTYILKNSAGKPVFDNITMMDIRGNLYIKNDKTTSAFPMVLTLNATGLYNASWSGGFTNNIWSMVAGQTNFADGSYIDTGGLLHNMAGKPSGYYQVNGDFVVATTRYKAVNGIVTLAGVPGFDPNVPVTPGVTIPPNLQVQKFDPITMTWV